MDTLVCRYMIGYYGHLHQPQFSKKYYLTFSLLLIRCIYISMIKLFMKKQKITLIHINTLMQLDRSAIMCRSLDCYKTTS